MAEGEQPSRLHPVQSSFSIPIEIRAEVVVDQLLPIEIKMDFDWNEGKRLSNLKDHGVDFRDAALIFEGPVIVKEDTRRITASNVSAPWEE